MIGAALLLLLLAPGAFAARRWFPGRGLLAAAALTQLLAYLLPLTLHLLGLPLRPLPLALALLPVNLLVLAFARPWASPPLAPEPAPERPWSPSERWTWALIGLISLVFVARTTMSPLQGFDVRVRWGLVADAIVEDASLEAYPPRSPEHFTKIYFKEGIPPLVMIDYAWSDWVFGSGTPRARNLNVLFQWLLALHGLMILGGGRRRGLYAMLAFCLTPRLIWGFAIGQETGWLTLGALGLFAAWRWEPGEASSLRRAALAGSFAAIGWLSREYGGALWALGLVEAWRLGRGRRELLVFSLIALGVPGTWFLRNAVLTGHPFYDLPVGGLFEIHPANRDMYSLCIEIIRRQLSVLGVVGGLLLAARFALLPLFVGFPAAVRQGREDWPLLLGALGFTLLFVISLPMTCGGLEYATRVLCPGLALLCLPAGAELARPLRGALLNRARRLAVGVVACWSVLCVVVLPFWPMLLKPTKWLEVAATLGTLELDDRDISPELARALREDVGEGQRVLVPELFWFASLERAGWPVISSMSPSVEALHSCHDDPEAAVRRLEGSGIGAVLFSSPRPPDTSAPKRSSLALVEAVIKRRWRRVVSQDNGGALYVPPR